MCKTASFWANKIEVKLLVSQYWKIIIIIKVWSMTKDNRRWSKVMTKCNSIIVTAFSSEFNQERRRSAHCLWFPIIIVLKIKLVTPPLAKMCLSQIRMGQIGGFWKVSWRVRWLPAWLRFERVLSDDDQ